MDDRRRKVSSSAVLKNLPPERQEQIAEWCRKPNDKDEDGKVIPETGGLAFARAQLGADGLRVSLDTLSQFFRWWKLEEDMEIAFEREDQILAKTGDSRKAREAGETLLMRLGLAEQDPELIAASAKIHDSRRNLDLQEASGKTKADLEAEKLKLRQVAEARAKESLALEREKFKAAIRTKVEAGLAEIAEQVKGNTAAEAALNRLQAAITTA